VQPESAVVDEGRLKFKRADLNCVFHVHQSQPDLYEAILNITDYCQATSSAEIQNLLNTIWSSKLFSSFRVDRSAMIPISVPC
jgi:hypothetical protein